MKPLIAEVGPLFRVFSPLKTVTYCNMLGKKCYLVQGGFCLFGFGDLFVCLFDTVLLCSRGWPQP